MSLQPIVNVEHNSKLLQVTDTNPPQRIPRQWLILVRLGWWMIAVLLAGHLLLNIRPYYTQLAALSNSELSLSLLPFDVIQTGLAQLGWSTSFYAGYLTAIQIVFSLAYCAVGILIFWRRPDEPMALLVSLWLVAFGTTFIPLGFLVEGEFPLLDHMSIVLGNIAFAAWFLLLYLFPDGRFVPRWTRWGALVMILLILIDLLWPDSPYNPDNWDLPGLLLIFSLLASMIYAQIYRYRRVSGPAQRQQTKWAAFGFSATMVAFIQLTFWEEWFASSSLSDETALLIDLVVATITMIVYLLIPLSVGLASLRYRLWDIDPLINRTLVYGGLTAGVVGIYVLVVGSLSLLFQTRQNFLISLFATGLVAILFQPLREQLQRGINHLLYGERDEPYTVLARLGERLETTLAPEAVLPTLVETVAQALKLPYVAIALAPENAKAAEPVPEAQNQVVAAVGTPVAEIIRLPLTYQGEVVGQMLLAPRAPGEIFSAADQRLLGLLARQAGVATHAVRLTSHLQQLTVDLQHSREQLILAREEERRRLRRDLHDGIGPTLASLSQRLDTARRLIPDQPETAMTLLDDLKTGVRSTIAEIRRLVYALRPPVLDEFGLLSAIREQAANYHQPNGLRVGIEAPDQLPPLPAAVEVAAYRIVMEALTNVVRHGQAESCLIRLTLNEQFLSLEVMDDGRGLPVNYQAGVGLTSMRERTTELGGEFQLGPASPHGTRISVRLPLSRE
jgi:signal transduction histidine kinase